MIKNLGEQQQVVCQNTQVRGPGLSNGLVLASCDPADKKKRRAFLFTSLLRGHKAREKGLFFRHLFYFFIMSNLLGYSNQVGN
jgi:hypothetical protein